MYSRVAPPEQCIQDRSSGAVGFAAKIQPEGEVAHDKNVCPENKPSHVASATWQKFQQLKERRRAVCKPYTDEKRRRSKKNAAEKGDALSTLKEKETKSHILCKNRNAWKELCQNIDVNSHLTQESTGKEKPKSKLEENLDEAIKKGDFSSAEELSNQIAQQELGSKIVDAMKVRDYKRQKEMDAKFQLATKKKKLMWGFEQKKRWERIEVPVETICKAVVQRNKYVKQYKWLEKNKTVWS